MKSQQPFPGQSHECSYKRTLTAMRWSKAQEGLHLALFTIFSHTLHFPHVTCKKSTFLQLWLTASSAQEANRLGTAVAELFTEGGCNEERRNAHICLRVNTLLIVVSRLQSYPSGLLDAYCVSIFSTYPPVHW